MCQDPHRRAREDLICRFETRNLNSWSTRAFIKSTSFSRRQGIASDDLPPPMSARRVDGRFLQEFLFRQKRLWDAGLISFCLISVKIQMTEALVIRGCQLETADFGKTRPRIRYQVMEIGAFFPHDGSLKSKKKSG